MDMTSSLYHDVDGPSSSTQQHSPIIWLSDTEPSNTIAVEHQAMPFDIDQAVRGDPYTENSQHSNFQCMKPNQFVINKKKKTSAKRLHRRPIFSYSTLITEALQSCEKMTVSQLCSWIADKYPDRFNLSDKRWKASVRNALTQKSHFIKDESRSKGNFWTLSQEIKLKLKASDQNPFIEPQTSHSSALGHGLPGVGRYVRIAPKPRTLVQSLETSTITLSPKSATMPVKTFGKTLVPLSPISMNKCKQELHGGQCTMRSSQDENFALLELLKFSPEVKENSCNYSGCIAPSSAENVEPQCSRKRNASSIVTPAKLNFESKSCKLPSSSQTVSGNKCVRLSQKQQDDISCGQRNIIDEADRDTSSFKQNESATNEMKMTNYLPSATCDHMLDYSVDDQLSTLDFSTSEVLDLF